MIRLKSLLKEEIKWMYHATTADRLPSIFSNGLLPSKNPRWGGMLGHHSMGRIFVTENFLTACRYGNSGIWKGERLNRFKPVLRFKYDTDNMTFDVGSRGDYFTGNPIKTNFDIFVPINDENHMDDHGDIWYKENDGEWRMLTKNVAVAIDTGEWDREIIDDL